MKKILISAVSAVILSSAAFGADKDVNIDGPYFGLAYSSKTMDLELKDFIEPDVDLDIEITQNPITLSAGYQFNKYIALEGRYRPSFTEASIPGEGDISLDLTNLAFYVKPIYPIDNTGLSVYALLGYGQSVLDISLTGMGGEKIKDESFQWGLGFSYSIDSHVDLFADYSVSFDKDGFDDMPNDAISVKVDAYTFGLSYKF